MESNIVKSRRLSFDKASYQIMKQETKIFNNATIKDRPRSVGATRATTRPILNGTF